MVKYGELVYIIPYFEIVCVENMGTIVMYRDSGNRAGIGVAGDMAPPVNHETALSILFHLARVAAECMEKIFIPTMEAMNSEGRTFKGCLYFGLMLTPKGPKVIEYNCRFGDPETQVVLPLLDSDLLEIMMAVADGTLCDAEVNFKEESACCVVVASDGYPQKYDSGFEITMPADKNIYVAGAKLADGKLLTAGGRVLGVTETAPSLKEAIDKAYATVQTVSFGNAYYRKDIGKRALEGIK